MYSAESLSLIIIWLTSEQVDYLRRQPVAGVAVACMFRVMSSTRVRWLEGLVVLSLVEVSLAEDGFNLVEVEERKRGDSRVMIQQDSAKSGRK